MLRKFASGNASCKNTYLKAKFEKARGFVFVTVLSDVKDSSGFAVFVCG